MEVESIPDNVLSRAAAVELSLLSENTGHTTVVWRSLSTWLSDCIRKRLDTKWCTRKLIEVLTDSAYDFVEYKTSSPPKSAFKKMVLHTVNRKGLPEIEKGILEGVAIARAKNATKDLGNRPAHDCTPTFIAKEAEKLAKKHSSISVDVLDEKAMKKLGMGCFLSVTQASVEAAKLVCIEYKPKGNKDKKPVVLVGKGITFDTGGLSLKPAKGMVPMKYDMLGAATVLSVLQAVAELNLSIPVIGVMACAENCIGSNATKPSAVVKSMKGLTVEVTNTDAEGRLVLSDALTYVERYNPDCVIDMATLTGGVIVALGDVASGVMSNHPPLQKALENAAESSRDLIWPLPIWDCYREKLDSQVADMRNEAGFPSSVLAGVFLSHFTQAYHWAHLDIAGTAFSESKMATGRPVPLLIEFLLARTTK
jgi:leucyl aminopeptidase